MQDYNSYSDGRMSFPEDKVVSFHLTLVCSITSVCHAEHGAFVGAGSVYESLKPSV